MALDIIQVVVTMLRLSIFHKWSICYVNFISFFLHSFLYSIYFLINTKHQVQIIIKISFYLQDSESLSKYSFALRLNYDHTHDFTIRTGAPRFSRFFHVKGTVPDSCQTPSPVNTYSSVDSVVGASVACSVVCCVVGVSFFGVAGCAEVSVSIPNMICAASSPTIVDGS